MEILFSVLCYLQYSTEVSRGVLEQSFRFSFHSSFIFFIIFDLFQVDGDIVIGSSDASIKAMCCYLWRGRGRGRGVPSLDVPPLVLLTYLYI